MSRPIIVFVPGLWEGRRGYTQTKQLLEKAVYETYVAELQSTGVPYSTDPKSPSMHDDITGIHEEMQVLTDLDRDIVIVMHSAGGFLGSEAIEGMSKPARIKQGKAGGVVHLVFVSAALVPEGHVHETMPFFEFEGPRMWCKSPRTILWNDLEPEAEAERLNKLMQPQPSHGWDGITRCCTWRYVPSSYLICEKEMVLPAEMQRQFAALAQSRLVESCDAGHMAPLTAPKSVADFIVKAITSPS